MSQKEIFHFTVGQLVEILNSMPQDLPIVTSGYETGYENIYRPAIMNLKHEPENPYYDGEFQFAEKENKDTFKAVVLERVRRDD